MRVWKDKIGDNPFSFAKRALNAITIKFCLQAWGINLYHDLPDHYKCTSHHTHIV